MATTDMTRAEFQDRFPNASRSTLEANGLEAPAPQRSAAAINAQVNAGMKDSAQAIKTPRIALQHVAGDPPAAQTEKQLQEQIVGFLRRQGKWVIRQRMDRKSNIALGTPDILCVHNGIPFAWEVKLPGRNPTPEQQRAGIEMQADGWRYAVIWSYDQAREEFAKLTK